MRSSGELNGRQVLYRASRWGEGSRAFQRGLGLEGLCGLILRVNSEGGGILWSDLEAQGFCVQD